MLGSRPWRVAATALVLAVGAGCVAPVPASTVPKPDASCEPPGLGTDFERASPGEVDLDASKVRQAVDYAWATAAISIRVYRRGCLVAEGPVDAVTSGWQLPAWSMTKGVLSVIVGRVVELGLLEVDDPVGPYLRAAGVAVDEVKARLTVRQFLTQTTGIRLPLASDVFEAAGVDSVAAVLARPFEAVPGSTFLYAQTAPSVLGAVVEGATGRDLQDFARDELFGPLGIGDDEWWWARDPAGNTQGFAFLSIAPRAMARIGLMLEAEGRWGSRQLVSADYIEQATVGTDANPCYGFLIRSNRRDRCGTDGVPSAQTLDRRWLPPAPIDAFGLSGMFDQETFVFPSLDLVVVRMGLPPLGPDPYGLVEGQQPRWQHRFTQMLMSSVLDAPQPAAAAWRPDPEPDGLDLHRIVALPMPEPWPPR